MIAKNFRKYPEAMALQLVLVFGRPMWNSSRPTTRVGRALRNAQAALVKATPQVVRWVKVATPQWFRDQVKRAKALAAQVRAALDSLVWDLAEAEELEDLDALGELFQAAKRMPREYLHTFALITSVIERPEWGPRFIHGRFGKVGSHRIKQYRNTESA